VIVLCAKCGGRNHTRPPIDDKECVHCGMPFSEQHLHIEMSPPPYPKASSPYPTITPAPRPVDDTGRGTWRAMISLSLGDDTRKLDFARHQFVPCHTCASKPGSPTLCSGCLANRQTIDELHERVRALLKDA
jgi:hypothetical protein